MVQGNAERILGGTVEEDKYGGQMEALHRLMQHEPVNTIAIGREISDAMVAAGQYVI